MNPPTPEQLGKLATAVGQVMMAAGAVQKTGFNKHSNYSYASDADMAYALQPAMAANGLVLFPHKQDVRTSEASGGSNMKYRVLTITTWRLIHSDGGWIELQTVGEGADALDKAAYKAQTGALKYALRQLFLVPTGDDPERDERNVAPESDDKKRKRLANAPQNWVDDQDRVGFMTFLSGIGIKYDDLKAYQLSRLQPKPSSATPDQRRKLAKSLENGLRAGFDTWLKARGEAAA